MSKSLAELVKAKKQDMSDKKGNFRTIKPPQGKSVIRILPSWRGKDEQFWHDFGQHWVKPEVGAKPSTVFVCPEKTWEKECEVCAAIAHAKSVASDRGDEKMVKLMDENRAQQQFLINVLVLSDKEKAAEPQVMALGSKLFDAIMAMWVEYNDEEEIDITCLSKGVDIKIERTGQGFDTSYQAMPSPKGSRPVGNKATIAAITEKIPNLDELIAAEFRRGSEKKALQGVATAAGMLPAPGSPADEALGGPDLSDVEDVEDADFEDIEEAALEDIEAEVEAEVEDTPVAEAEAAEDDDDDEGFNIDDLLADEA